MLKIIIKQDEKVLYLNPCPISKIAPTRKKEIKSWLEMVLKHKLILISK